jgi:rubredoxin
MSNYHPDPEINAEIIAESLESERIDLAAGYLPRFWRCPDCGAGHGRGHFQVIGVHRCLGCGYVGEGGTMHTEDADGRLVGFGAAPTTKEAA